MYENACFALYAWLHFIWTNIVLCCSILCLGFVLCTATAYTVAQKWNQVYKLLVSGHIVSVTFSLLMECLAWLKLSHKLISPYAAFKPLNCWDKF